jgi:integrase
MASGKLNALKVKTLTKLGRYGDGSGLWLQVRDAEHRSWLFRYMMAGKQRQMGLGPFPDVSLAEARDEAHKCRAAVRRGVDPIEDRRQAKAATRDKSRALTFRQVADRYIAAHEPGWRNEKHKYQWRQTLDVACEQIGAMPVDAITTGDVMSVLEPIWRTKSETASRLRGRIESVLDYAAARSWRTGENPARWRGHLAKLLPAPSKVTTVQHHAALEWRHVNAFMAELRDADGVAARALEFTILTAARTGEAIGAKWTEVDMQAATWVVPAIRMKAGREHKVPLSEAALGTLRSMLPLRDAAAGDWVFPGKRRGKPLSNMGMMMLLRRMQRGDLTVHGFRSAFRDWCSESTNHPREVAEQALAHILADKVEAAYRRGDLFEKRRLLMEDWAKFCAHARAADLNVPGELEQV